LAVTGKADFSEEEWTTVLEGPTSAGMIIVTAEKGGAIRETMEMAKVWTEVRKQHGQGQLLDEIAAAKPKVDRERAHSPEELKQHGLDNVREAAALVESKASEDEVGQYKGFVLSIAQHVAERVKGASDSEKQAIQEIAGALGTDSPA
jgi:hypothetical protein